MKWTGLCLHSAHTCHAVNTPVTAQYTHMPAVNTPVTAEYKHMGCSEHTCHCRVHTHAMQWTHLSLQSTHTYHAVNTPVTAQHTHMPCSEHTCHCRVQTRGMQWTHLSLHSTHTCHALNTLFTSCMSLPFASSAGRSMVSVLGNAITIFFFSEHIVELGQAVTNVCLQSHYRSN